MITDDELAAALLLHPGFSTSQLAKFLGVREHFVQYRITRPGFAYKVAILRNSGFADAASTGQAGLAECLEVFQKEMRSDLNFSGERTNAAKAFVDSTIKFHQIHHQDIEILRLRAFVEENESRRMGISTEVDDGEDSTGQHLPSPSPASQRSGEGGGDYVSVQSVPVADVVGGLESIPPDPTGQEQKVIAPDVQRRLLDIVAKTTGEK